MIAYQRHKLVNWLNFANSQDKNLIDSSELFVAEHGGAFNDNIYEYVTV